MFHLRFIGLAVSLLALSLIVLSVLNQAQAQTQSGAQDEASGFQAEADAIAAHWTETLNGRFRELAALDEQAFITGWAEEIDGWKTQLRALEVEHDRSAEAYITRIHYEWAIGRLFYGPMHGRLTQDRAFRPTSTYDAYLDEVDLGRADLLELDEYRSFIERLRDYWADTRFDEDVPGTVQFLTAKLDAGHRFTHPDIQCYLNTQSLRLWVEENAADGLQTEAEDHHAACPGEASDDILAMVAAERAERDGHIIETFKTVDGYDLEIHIYLPDDRSADDDLRPAMVWVHGGGWFFGSWSWCGPCRFFKDRGHVVAQIEYRTRGRFGVRAGDSLADVTDAIAWLRENAQTYGIDASRIGVSGFSAGAHLSVAAATLEAPTSPSRPDLALSFSGCMDMTDDGYMISIAGGWPTARSLSPLHMMDGPLPPLFIAHAHEDTDCSFETATAFAQAARAQGTSVDMIDFPQAGHFFLRDPDRAHLTRTRVNAFLDQHGY